jgi:hypothetical protein
MMDKQALAALVSEILAGMGQEPQVKGSTYLPTDPGPQAQATGLQAGDFVPDVTQLELRKLYLTEDPANK